MKTSVALCTYNGEKFLQEQLDSILKQTVPVDEIVVCDDGSTDSTIEILESYSHKNPGIFKIFRNDVNLRSVKNFEKAISLCSNEIIFLSDQDDLWIENKVEKIVKTFQENPEINMVATNASVIDKNGINILESSIWEIVEENVHFFEIISLHQNFVTGATLAIRKETAMKAIPFPKIFHHDEWLALKTSKEQSLKFIKEPLIYYRIHDKQHVGGILITKKKFDFIKSKIEKYPNQLNPKQSFSLLKKWKRKIDKLTNCNETCSDVFIEYLINFLRTEQEKLRKISSEKFHFQYQFQKLFGKI